MVVALAIRSRVRLFRMRDHDHRWDFDRFTVMNGLVSTLVKVVPYFAVQVYVLSQDRWNFTSQLSILAASLNLLKSTTTWLVVCLFVSRDSEHNDHHGGSPGDRASGAYAISGSLKETPYSSFDVSSA
jgi:hypothetical protein